MGGKNYQEICLSPTFEKEELQKAKTEQRWPLPAMTE